MILRYIVRYFANLLLPLLFLINTSINVKAQISPNWSPQLRIPGYNDNSQPPYLISDQNNTIHAFGSQQIGAAEKEVAIVYNQWSPEQGWSLPVDVILSPLKNEAWIKGAYLDKFGIIHVIFIGGDETESNVYYVQAPAIHADQSKAWSEPILVGRDSYSPSTATLIGIPDGDLFIIYGGDHEGNGVYSTFSGDRGKTWSEPYPIFLTNNQNRWAYNLLLHIEENRMLHAIWNVVDIAGQGRSIYYANQMPSNGIWSDPIKLDDSPSGLGIMTPAISSHNGELFVLYNKNGKIYMRRSGDNGVNWTEPTIIFTSHGGVNGTISLAIDNNQDMHLFFGQRITGSPDIHGMWHSVWLGTYWSTPNAVVSGPRIIDVVNDNGFDPYDARAVVNQGNQLLVTWRTDPGDIKPNGVWYSHAYLDIPGLPITPFPTIHSNFPALPTVVNQQLSPTLKPTWTVSHDDNQNSFFLQNRDQNQNPTLIVLVSIVPVVFVVLIILFLLLRINSSR